MSGVFANNFLVGINICWLEDQYDHDLGYNMLSTSVFYNEPYYTINPPNSLPSKPFVETEDGRKALDDMFRGLGRVHNICVIRIWAFERFEALQFDENFNIVGIDSHFLTNIERLLDKAKEYHIKIYLCLLDAWPIYKSVGDEFNIRVDLELLEGAVKQKAIDYQNLQHIWKQIIKAIVKDSAVQMSFLTKALLPLLTKIGSHESLFAIDVFNEPESLTEKDPTQFKEQDIIQFVNNVSKYIKNNSAANVSCGFKTLATINRNVSRLSNLDFFDYHSYQERAKFQLDNYSPQAFGGKDCIIGECGYPVHLGNNKESENMHVLNLFFEQAATKGYSGIIPWIKDYVNSGALLDRTIAYSMTFPTRKSQKTEAEDKKCFIATAALGTTNDARVYYLREYRKFVLKKSRFKALIRILLGFYYVASPPLAKIIRTNKHLRYWSITFFVNPLLAIVKLTVRFQLGISKQWRYKNGTKNRRRIV